MAEVAGYTRMPVLKKGRQHEAQQDNDDKPADEKNLVFVHESELGGIISDVYSALKRLTASFSGGLPRELTRETERGKPSAANDVGPVL